MKTLRFYAKEVDIGFLIVFINLTLMNPLIYKKNEEKMEKFFRLASLQYL